MQKKNIILFTSFFLLNFFGWIILPSVELGYGLPILIKYFLSLIVLGILIWYRVINPSKPEAGAIFKIPLIFFIIWSVILLLLALVKYDGLFFLQRLLAIKYFYIPYLLPLILLFTRFDLEFFGDLFRISFLFLIPSLIIQTLVLLINVSQTNWLAQSTLIGIFDVCIVFLLFTSHIVRKKYIFYFALCYYLLWILLWSLYGRRGMLVNSIFILLFMLTIRYRSIFLTFTDRLKMVVSAFMFALLFLAYGYLFTSTYVFQRGFNLDAVEQSRGTVFEAFFYDFKSFSDWILGRGLDGTVLRSFNTYNQFSSIENGFLTILLKGGLLYSIPFVIILLRASFLGFFRSRNDLAKALGSIIFIHVIMMVSFNLPEYSTYYILVWISVSACFTPSIRNCSNKEVYRVINSRI